MKLTSEQNKALAREMRAAGDTRLTYWRTATEYVRLAMSEGRSFEQACREVADDLSKHAPKEVAKRPARGEAFRAIWDAADKAGKAAAAAKVPVPMFVGTPTHPLGNDIDPTQPIYHVPDGVCGFAWVKWKGNTSWGRWTAKEGLARKSYEGGLSYWISDYGQSMERKEAYAYAFAAVLQENGIADAYAASRMD